LFCSIRLRDLGSGATRGWRKRPSWQRGKHSWTDAIGSADQQHHCATDGQHNRTADRKHYRSADGFNVAFRGAGLEFHKSTDGGQQHAAFDGESEHFNCSWNYAERVAMRHDAGHGECNWVWSVSVHRKFRNRECLSEWFALPANSERRNGTEIEKCALPHFADPVSGSAFFVGACRNFGGGN
jgi:hypothetical protein